MLAEGVEAEQRIHEKAARGADVDDAPPGFSQEGKHPANHPVNANQIDGEYWHSRPGMPERDRKKDGYLKSHGYTVLRFPEAAIRASVESCVDRVVETLVNYYQSRGSKAKGHNLSLSQRKS